jgi:hypothetical protein
VGWESVAQRPGNRGVEACPPRHGRAGGKVDARVAPSAILRRVPCELASYEDCARLGRVRTSVIRGRLIRLGCTDMPDAG